MTLPNKLTWTPSNDLPERVYMGTHTTEMKGEGGASEQAARTCTKPTLGHKLAFFIWAHVPGHALTLNDPPK